MKIKTYLLASMLLFCFCPILYSQVQYNWNDIIENTMGLEIDSAKKNVNITRNTDSWSIHSIFWNNSVDVDGDGYTRRRHLNWTWTTSYNPSFSVYFRLFYKEKTQGSYELYVESPELVGTCTYSYCDYEFTDFVIGEVITLSHDEYDFKMELYDYSTNTLLGSATPSNHASFNDQKFESPSQDTTLIIDWTLLPSITTNNLRCIQFVNENVGWIGGNYGTLIKTTDGGNTWQFLSIPNKMVYSLFFISENTGWISLHGGLVADPKIYKTTDGGTTWTPQLSGTNSGAPESMFFLNANTGYAASQGFFWKTTNGGTTWTQVNSPSGGKLESIYFFTESEGWAAGYGFLAKTTDGTNSWTTQFTQTNHQFKSVFFNDENNGLACGRWEKIYKTNDGGQNWEVVHNTWPNGVLYDIVSINTNTAFSVGGGGKIFKTIDAGLNWTQQNSGTEETLTEIDFSDESNGWAVGDNGVILHREVPESFLSVSTEQINLDFNESAAESFNIYSNVAYSITTESDWISITPGASSNNSEITVTTLSQNTNPLPRNCEITVLGTELAPIIIEVTQQATPFLDVSPANIDLDTNSGSSDYAYIESNINWTVSYNASWLSVDPLGGSNNESILISTTSTNSTVNERTAIITFSGEDVSDKTVTVTQYGSSPYLNISTEEINLSPVSGSNDSFSVSSNTNWTISDNANWLDVNPTFGSGDKQITVTASNENISINTRTATITVSVNGVSNKTIIVTQEGAIPFLELNTNVITIDYLGGSSASFDIFSNVSWTLETNENWFIMSQTNGSNNETIMVTALSNNEQSQTRTGLIAISGLDTLGKNVTFIQLGNTAVNEHKYAKYISVFPNPTNGTVKLKIKTQNIISAKIIIYDIFGKPIYSNSFNKENSDIVIDIIHSGQYYLQIIDNDGQVIKTEKMIVN